MIIHYESYFGGIPGLALTDFITPVLTATLKGLFLAIAALPQWCLNGLAKATSLLVLLAASKKLRVLDQNLSEILNLPAHSGPARTFRRQVLHSQALIALEAIKGATRPDRIEVVGLPELASAMESLESQGRGQIMISAHLGNWELIAQKSAELTGKTYHALAKPARFRFVTKALDWQRSRMKIKVLWTEQKTLLRQMLIALQNGHWVSFVMDQKPQNRQGPEVTFFGHRLAFVSGPAAMSLRSGVPIMAVFCVRIGPSKYRMISQAIDLSTIEPTPEAVSQVLATAIESAIKLYPEQWCWNYRRWKFPPKEEFRDD